MRQLGCWAAALACVGAHICAAGASETIEFNRDIRPILSDRCYNCHGPDQAQRKSKLRLDREESAKSDLGGRFGIVPGDAARSEVIRRIASADAARRMPPAWAGAEKLPEREIELIRKWIEQGARWQKHWSFIPPQRPAPPAVSDASRVRNPIDAFVLARLDREGLKPSPEADRRRLIRRVTLDLTGLPPTPAEVETFVNDPSADAYDKVVDRLLASPRYGERMAARWLDAARYADTNGYQTDGERFMWRWRDWVIDAFNRNMRYDRFAVEQVAGDLLPGATTAQVIATGFNRNHRGNGEGGIIPEEYAVEYVVDRVETTSTVWLGLTLGCARCHDHKYDPFTQKEFYRLFAYFNNVPERGKAFKYGNSPPAIPAPTPEQEKRLHALEAELRTAEGKLAGLEPEIAERQRKWETDVRRKPGADWAPARHVAVHLPLDGGTAGEFHHDPPQGEKYTYLMENGPATTEAPAPAQFAPAWKEGAAEYQAGRFGQAGAFDGKRYLEVGNIANFGFYDAFTLAAWIYPTSASGTIVSRSKDEPEGQGFGLHLKDGRLQAWLVQRWLDDGARVETETTVELNRWSHVMLTYDGSRLAQGIHIYINGREAPLKIQLDDLNQSFAAKQPLRIGTGLGAGSRFRGLIDEVRIYRAAGSAEQAAVLAVPETVARIAGMAARERSRAQADKLRWCYLDGEAPAELRRARTAVLELREQRARMIESLPTVMVMQESPTPRETHVLIRGAYDRPGEKVEPGVPAVLPPLEPGAPNNRLGLARWLVDRSNPLTARVAVNRFWQMYFGTGLVKTAEDFGSQGEWPSHPELLDWLATEFIDSGWDVKRLQKTIVTSATYRQSSRVTPELLQKDPDNRLLARGPRLRLPAEVLRDQALAVAGLLVEKIGGPSVKPYQPPGLWKELTGGADYKPDTGEGLHRRSLYTFWKRTAPPPMMINFDAAGREACVVRLSRTNTPLQALDLMNDPMFVEAARGLAERAMREGGRTSEERIGFAFRLATAREPKPAEREVLLRGFRYYRDLYQGDPGAAGQYLKIGGLLAAAKLEGPDLAAYTAVASLILNLDATVTKD